MGMHAVPWRAHAMLLPMAVFARRVPIALQLPLIFFAAIANAALAVLFFRNVVQ